MELDRKIVKRGESLETDKEMAMRYALEIFRTTEYMLKTLNCSKNMDMEKCKKCNLYHDYCDFLKIRESARNIVYSVKDKKTMWD